MPSDRPKFPNLLVVIGASAGGLRPVFEILEALPRDYQAVVAVAMHRNPRQSHDFLPELVDGLAGMRVSQPVVSEKLLCTTIYLGRPSEALQIDDDEVFTESVRTRAERMSRIDDLFRTAAESAGSNTVGVVLSGCLYDGVDGMLAIHRAGGRCLVQDPRDAAFGELPQAVLDEVPVGTVGTAPEIAAELIAFAAGRECR